MKKRRRLDVNGSLEENTMAILNTSGFNKSKMSYHLNNDQFCFLEAVRTTSLLPENGSAPTRKMFDAIFKILRDEDPLDLIVQSFQLLIELDKRFPRLYLCNGEQSGSSSPSKVLSQLIMVEEAWAPFNFAGDNKEEASFDSLGFHSLVQEVAKSESVGPAFLKNMLLLQYLITVLEGDFMPRNTAYQESTISDWILLRESLLNMLLMSRKITYKGLIKDCLSVICKLSQSTVLSKEATCLESSSGETSHETNSALDLAIPQAKKSTCILLKKFVTMLMELDLSRRIADQQGCTNRVDGVRSPVLEIILDELSYDNDILYSFLQVFDEPKWKLEIIVQFFQKYLPKASVQTRRSSNTINVQNFDGVLKCLSNRNSTKTIIKKIRTEVVQLLLAHAFQAYLTQSYQDVSEGLSDKMEDDGSSSIVEACKNVLSAFTCLKQEDREMEILSFSRVAMFTAATILSTKS